MNQRLDQFKILSSQVKDFCYQLNQAQLNCVRLCSFWKTHYVGHVFARIWFTKTFCICYVSLRLFLSTQLTLQFQQFISNSNSLIKLLFIEKFNKLTEIFLQWSVMGLHLLLFYCPHLFQHKTEENLIRFSNLNHLPLLSVTVKSLDENSILKYLKNWNQLRKCLYFDVQVK